jgi:divalent metal cation (Fe/Co/Zn/Cd) transporter
LLPYVFADFDGRVSLTVPNDVWTRVVVIVALVTVYAKFPIIAAILAVFLGNILFVFTIFKALVNWSLAKCGYPMFRFLV